MSFILIVVLSVDVTSHPVSPIWPIGSNVTLTCTVELSPAVDVPVTVNTVWTGPAGFMRTNSAPSVMGNTTTYNINSTAVVMSFNRNKSGDYICRATVTSESAPFIAYSSLSGIKRITAGNIILFAGLTYP